MRPGIYSTGREALVFLGGACALSILAAYVIGAVCYGLGRLTIAVLGL
jgi:hypothetical protein